jgi:dTDP-glucose 4,6-dehydratase
MSMQTVLVTGAAGFIGPKVVGLLLRNDYRVIVIDKLTYAARVEHIDGYERPISLDMELDSLGSLGSLSVDQRKRYWFLKGDIADPTTDLKKLLREEKVDYVINMAAESHVDRSTEGKPDFIHTEIYGTYSLLEAIRAHNESEARKIKRVVFVSTDEVYGSIDRSSGHEGKEWYALTDKEVSGLIEKYRFNEETSLSGGSPYAACKGGADLLVGAYFNTFKWNRDNGEVDLEKMPVIITRGVNNFGPYQHPEKLIPMATCTLLSPFENRHIPIYDKGLAVREWLTTEDYASAIFYVMQNGKIGEVYNVGSGNRCRNRDLLLMIFEACRPHTRFHDLASASFDATTTGGIARPGHDLCYSINCQKLRALGWQPQHAGHFQEKIQEVVEWYVENRDWWEPVWTGSDFTDFWNRKYRKIMESDVSPSIDFYTEEQVKRSLQEVLL